MASLFNGGWVVRLLVPMVLQDGKETILHMQDYQPEDFTSSNNSSVEGKGRAMRFSAPTSLTLDKEREGQVFRVAFAFGEIEFPACEVLSRYVIA